METSAELVGTQPLEFWEFGLEDSQNAKISWFHEKKLACTDSHVQPIGWPSYEGSVSRLSHYST